VQAPLPFDDSRETCPLRVVVLGSGSGGNAVVVECGGQRVLIDAGFSCRELERRMRAVGVDPSSIEALLVTHEHDDHVRGADRFARKWNLPLHATAGTLAGSPLGEDVLARARRFASGEPFAAGPFAVEPFAIPHDAREPVGFVLEAGGRRVGLVADLGYASRLAWGRLVDLDLLILETNHDLDMLRSGPYPWPLKQRVASRHGHLSNGEASEALPELVGDRLRFVVLYHLSRTNNLPALAAAAVGEELSRAGARAEVVVSDQFRPTPWLEVTT
jgi:phosphoribosyl 1,2-cyclic phosphodiesterase